VDSAIILLAGTSLLNLHYDKGSISYFDYFALVVYLFLAVWVTWLASNNYFKSKYNLWKLKQIEIKHKKEETIRIAEYAKKMTKKENYFK
jgi:hypothetical protein